MKWRPTRVISGFRSGWDRLARRRYAWWIGAQLVVASDSSSTFNAATRSRGKDRRAGGSAGNGGAGVALRSSVANRVRRAELTRRQRLKTRHPISQEKARASALF